MNIVEGAIDYVRNKALEIKKDPTWTDIPFKKKKDFMTQAVLILMVLLNPISGANQVKVLK